jgi:CRP/FNR family cyclic AMP-dependent transcriptional regulator
MWEGTMKAIASVLAENADLAGLGREYLNLLADCAKNIDLEENQLLLDPGQEANSFFVLRTGEVVLDVPYEHGAITVQKLSGGDLLGWSWILPGSRLQFRARALTRGQAVQVDAKCVRGKFASNPEFERAFLKQLMPVAVKRLNATQMQLVEAYRAAQE